MPTPNVYSPSSATFCVAYQSVQKLNVYTLKFPITQMSRKPWLRDLVEESRARGE